MQRPLACLLMLPALALSQASDTQPVRHDTVEVHDKAPDAATAASSSATSVKPGEVKNLPSRPATVNDALPLLPGIVRSPTGGLQINGTGEQHSAMLVNQADVTDPATGGFGASVPVDSVQVMNFFSTPFQAQYGRFSSGVVAVETRRGSDKWHYEVNDPLPDFRFRSWHMHGLQDASPRFVLGGPLIANRLYFAQTVLYDLQKLPNRTLPFPDNTSKQERVNSFTQVDYVLSARQLLTATLHVTPQHINFVNPDFFNPEPVTPNYRQQSYMGTVADHFAIGQSMLDSSVSFQRFDATVGTQGSGAMFLSPTGNFGNYFAAQKREAGRIELSETWSMPVLHYLGTHELKFGGAATHTSDTGAISANPINIQDASGNLLQQIGFVNGSPYSHYDVETTFFAQDHWAVGPHAGFDLGSRLERQSIAESFRIAPRAGFWWAPFGESGTILQTGYGVFYDRVPLEVYAFDRFPQRVVTDYGPGGLPVGPPVTYMNLFGYAAASPLIHSELQPGNFAPHSGTWNAHLEHRLSANIRLRAGYTLSQSSGLILLEPGATAGVNALMLNGSGRASYSAADVTARFGGKFGQWFVAYTRARSQGDLNDFSGYLGNYPSPLIRPNLYGNLNADLPNRFLAWGTVKLPWQMQILPLIEYRNGLPYSQYNVLGNYAAAPNSQRFPNFFSTDLRLLKDFKVNPKYTLRFSVSSNNVTNHFNALAVHSNIADPASGVFFGNYPRKFRVDFDVLF
jgi:hypothetical protein